MCPIYDKLDVCVPHNLEVQWGLVRPREITPNTKYNECTIGSFYSPPASRKNKKMLDHLTSCTHALMTKFPGAAVILAGDKNELPLASLLLGLPHFSQSVAQNTHKDKIIDVIITNCGQYYAVPEVTSPILPDRPHHAAPSDHKVPVARPLLFYLRSRYK